MINIRKATAIDYPIIYEVVKASFKDAEHCDGNEKDLVIALSKSNAYIPELSLVAEENGEIIGHILFTQAQVGGEIILALAPLSVLPEHQRKGVGSSLIKKGHKIAQQIGYPYSVVLGSETYYPKFGYKPAINLGIKPPFPVDEKNFMAIKLQENAPEIHA